MAYWECNNEILKEAGDISWAKRDCLSLSLLGNFGIVNWVNTDMQTNSPI